MQSKKSRTAAQAVLFSGAVVAAVTVSAAEAAGPLGLEQIKAPLAEQREKIRSLHIRVRRVTTVSLDPKTLAGWPDESFLPEYSGTDEVIVAFKGDKRYWRVVVLDYKCTFPSKRADEEGDEVELYTDEARTCNEQTLFERKKAPGYSYQHRSGRLSKARDAFPPSEYLMNVGLAVPDPTGEDEAGRNFQQMGLLPDLLERWGYGVSEKTEPIDGSSCVVLEGAMQCRLPLGKGSEGNRVSDTLWLDLEHGLALRKRETRVAGQLRRVLNTDFEEVLPGFWLPRQSQTQTFAPAGAARGHGDRPVMTRDMKLCLWVVNQTPDDLFDAALLPRKWERPLIDGVPAFHLRRQRYDWRDVDPSRHKLGGTEEVWVVRGVGRRVEVRDGSELRKLIVETPRWQYEWDVARNRVVASPSLLEKPSRWPAGWGPRDIVDRKKLMQRYDADTGIPACETVRLDGREVEKMTVYLPPDPDEEPYVGLSKSTQYCVHGFNPKKHLHLSGTEFRGRVYWFDPKSGLVLQRRCGCKRPNKHTHDEKVDYPAPESVPERLFFFPMPRDALLEVRDPELGREAIYSEGQRRSDLPE